MKYATAILLAASLVVVAVAGHAKDLGVRGATWPVAEPDLLAEIEARLLEMQRSGELARLETQVLARDLLFVDGRREAEIAWALAHEIERGRPAKIVLLAGRPLDLMRRHRRPFFFDMGGRLAARFGLRLTPVMVEQAGTRLRITEIPVADRDLLKPRQED